MIMNAIQKNFQRKFGEFSSLRILENTPSGNGGYVKEQNTVWKWKELAN